MPDDQDVRIAVQAWDRDADDTHKRFEVATGWEPDGYYGEIEWGLWYTLTAAGTRWYNSSGLNAFRLDPLTVTVTTVIPSRIDSRLIVPADYAGVYNVTDDGFLDGRRYVGEPKFYAIIVNLTDAGYGFNGQKETWLVPRSVFFDTYLSTRLNEADNMTGTWLADAANDVQFSQNSSEGPGTSALEGTLTAHIDWAEYTTMRDWLLSNVSGKVTQTYIRIDRDPAIGDYFFLVGLPDAIVQLASYQTLPNTPTQTYVFDYRPVWQRIWDGTVGAALGWISSGFVAALNFMANLPTMLVQLGAWLWSGIVGAAQAVASAVQAAAEVLGQVFGWIVAFVEDTLRAVVKPILDLMAEWLSVVGGAIRGLLNPNPAQLPSISEASAALANAIFEHAFSALLLGFAIALQVLEGVLIAIHVALPGGVVLGVAVRGLLASAAKTAIERWVIAGVAAFAVGAILGFVLPETHAAWDIPLTVIGVSLGTFAVFFSQVIWIKFTKDKYVFPGAADVAGFILAVVGFIFAWQLPAIGIALEIVSIFGALIALIGLGIAIHFESPIDTVGGPVVGKIDEIADVGFFGFAVGQAIRENTS